MEPVLVLRALGLGDALTGVPALRGLRRLHPDRPILLAAAAVIGRWFTDLGLVDGFVPTSGLDDVPPGRDLGPHDAVNLHGRGPQSHALLLAGQPRSLLAFAPPQGLDLGTDADPATAEPKRIDIHVPADAPPWRADEHEVLRWCRLVSWAGGRCGPDDLRLAVSPERPPECAEGCAATTATTPAPPHPSVRESRPYMVLHPGAASRSRRWPADRWAQVARVLSRRTDVLLTGSPDERRLCLQVSHAAGLDDASVVAGDLSLSQLLALVGHARLLLCGDTGVAHVATATGTPSVLLFGPTAPRLWGPLIDRGRHACLWHGDGTGDPHADVPDRALLRITVAEVLVAADALLDRESRGLTRSATLLL